MEVLIRQPVAPGQLDGFMKAEDWRKGHENVFPVRHALRHFLRTRMAQLRARGLVR